MRKLLVSFFVVLSIEASAADSGSRLIERVEASDVWFTLHPESVFNNTESCEDSSKVVFWASDFPQGHDQILSTALSAMMANKKISMWFNGCKMGPWGKTLPKASTINVYK